MARNRVIYQSQALFIAPSSTGVQVSGTTGPNVGINLTSIVNPSGTGELASGISLLKKMDRIQSCNFNFTINRQDINEFGKLARIDSIVMETPTVGLDFSYYVTDGYNERLMGFNITGFKSDGSTFIDTNIVNGAQAISGLLSDLQGNNYYILTVDEGEDVVGGNLTPSSTIVALGNGFISEYGFEASVGAIPTASITVEAFNIKSDASEAPLTLTSQSIGTADANIVTITGASPAVDLFANPATKLTNVKNAYKLDYSRDFINAAINSVPGVNFTGFTTGSSTVSALRPGDIQLTLPSSEGLTNLSTAHIQSFSFTLPLSRTVLQRLGNTFGFARVIDVPINMDLNLSAIVSELRDENLFDILASPTKQDFTIALKDSSGNRKIAYTIKGAILQSETYSENLGDNQTVDLTYTVQIGGANDTTAGLFMSGSYANSLDSITSGFFKLGTGKLG
ncbi:hypothetical protein EB151_06210 [archaeon]|nr:hypothetical protein [archaeon]